MKGRGKKAEKRRRGCSGDLEASFTIGKQAAELVLKGLLNQ